MQFNNSIVISGFLNQNDNEIIFKSSPLKIGKLYWIVVVYEDLKFDHEQEKMLNKRYGTSISNGIFTTYCFYKEGEYFKSHWACMKEHPNYNINDGTYYGLPKSLSKLFDSNEIEIKNALKGNRQLLNTLF